MAKMAKSRCVDFVEKYEKNSEIWGFLNETAPTTLHLLKAPFISLSSGAEMSASAQIVHEQFLKTYCVAFQISNGSSIMVVEFFPISAPELFIPPPLGNVSFDRSLVLEGIISDDLCKENPCNHNGVCQNTWNDYRCQCTRGRIFNLICIFIDLRVLLKASKEKLAMSWSFAKSKGVPRGLFAKIWKMVTNVLLTRLLTGSKSPCNMP